MRAVMKSLILSKIAALLTGHVTWRGAINKTQAIRSRSLDDKRDEQW